MCVIIRRIWFCLLSSWSTPVIAMINTWYCHGQHLLLPWSICSNVPVLRCAHVVQAMTRQLFHSYSRVVGNPLCHQTHPGSQPCTCQARGYLSASSGWHSCAIMTWGDSCTSRACGPDTLLLSSWSKLSWHRHRQSSASLHMHVTEDEAWTAPFCGR